MLKLSTKLDLFLNKSLFTFSKQSTSVSLLTEAYTKSIYQSGIYIASEMPEKNMDKRQERKRAGSGRKPNNKNKKNDDENRGGGLLEPIIEDWKEWISRRKPQPQIFA